MVFFSPLKYCEFSQSISVLKNTGGDNFVDDEEFEKSDMNSFTIVAFVKNTMEGVFRQGAAQPTRKANHYDMVAMREQGEPEAGHG